MLKSILITVFALVTIATLFTCNRKIKQATSTPKVPSMEETSTNPDLKAETKPEVIKEEEVVVEVIPEEDDLIVQVFSIQRTPCFGKCPVYEAIIYNDGSIAYTGRSNVGRIGKFTGQLNEDQMTKIWNKAEAIDYFKLEDQYPTDGQKIPDLPMTITSMNVENMSKTIRNNFKSPIALQDFEKLLDTTIEEVDWTKVGDLNEVYTMASIRRTPCFGTCKTYKAAILSDGTITYQGYANVEKVGIYTAKTPTDMFKKLWNKAKEINYFELEDKYPTGDVNIADLPTTVTTMNVGNKEKKISNMIQGPKGLKEFERLFDTLLDSITWTIVKED